MKKSLSIFSIALGLLLTSCGTSSQYVHLGANAQKVATIESIANANDMDAIANDTKALAMLDKMDEQTNAIINNPDTPAEKLTIAKSVAKATSRLKSVYADKTLDFNTFRKEMKSIRKDMNKDIMNVAKKKNSSDGDGSTSSWLSFGFGVAGLLIAGILFGAAAIVFGIIGISKGGKPGWAWAGLALGVIDLVLVFLYLINRPQGLGS